MSVSCIINNYVVSTPIDERGENPASWTLRRCSPFPMRSRADPPSPRKLVSQRGALLQGYCQNNVPSECDVVLDVMDPEAEAPTFGNADTTTAGAACSICDEWGQSLAQGKEEEEGTDTRYILRFSFHFSLYYGCVVLWHLSDDHTH